MGGYEAEVMGQDGHCTMYGPAPEPLKTVAPLKFQLNTVPVTNVPVAAIATGVFMHACAGNENAEEGGAVIVTFAIAGEELHPEVVTTKLALCAPAVAQFALTGPALLEFKGVAPGNVQA